MNKKKNQTPSADIAKELEEIYENKFAWVRVGEELRNRFADTLKEKPKMNLVLKLCVVSNIGIWLAVALIVHTKIFGL